MINFKKWLSASVAGVMIAVTGAGAAACKKDEDIPLDSSHGIADQSNLYGMCYLLEERSTETLDIGNEVLLMKNLGVRTVRQWMHFPHFMSNPKTLKENCEATKNMHDLLAACEEAGMTNIGMNHHNFNATGNTVAKPYKRDVSSGSAYVEWLNDYYDSWRTLVKEFPEVKYWEIDNEVNNSDFMWNGVSHDSYSVKEMAEIATDMFYYASRAIHDENPAAQTIMGGLTEPKGLGMGNTPLSCNCFTITSRAENTAISTARRMCRRLRKTRTIIFRSPAGIRTWRRFSKRISSKSIKSTTILF